MITLNHFELFWLEFRDFKLVKKMYTIDTIFGANFIEFGCFHDFISNSEKRTKIEVTLNSFAIRPEFLIFKMMKKIRALKTISRLNLTKLMYN